MKKILLLAAMSATLFITSCKDEKKEEPKMAADKLAITSVEAKNTSFVVKFSGTSCPPCGGWGWTVMQELIDGIGDNGIATTCYGQNFVAKYFITPEATTLQTAWGATGYPHFGANGSITTVSRSSGVNTAAEKVELFDRVTKHAAAEVMANVGVNYEIVDGKVNMKYQTKAFKALDGDNHLAIYILEHNVVGAQSGHPDGANTKHKHIMRKEITAGAGYGSSIGALTSGQKIDGSQTFDLDPTWNADNIEIVAVLYTKVGTKFTFVNASRAKLVM